MANTPPATSPRDSAPPTAWHLFTGMRRLFGPSSLVVLMVIAWGCSNDTVDPPTEEAAPQTTWGVIQTQILDVNCISCHSAGTSFAKQSGLVLTNDVAYDQLVGRTPHNEAAQSDGLLRVGTEGLASLAKSFLWEKINAPNQEHFFADHPYYGGLMPLGADPLTNGEIEFIRQWIVAGAPKDGIVADEAVLVDTERYEPPTFKPMAPPESGYQLRLGPFEVYPNYERELYYYVPLDNTEDVFVTRTEIRMRPGSHHFILYRFQDGTPASSIPAAGVIRDIRDANGNYIVENLLATQYHEYVMGTQWPLMDYRLPPGVGLRIPAGSGFDMNSHYVNRSDKGYNGEVVVNVHTVERSQIDHVAETLFLNNKDFTLPPHQITTVEKDYLFAERRYIFQLFSHAHEHMTEFRVYISGGERDGELVYIAYDWEHPPILELNPPLVLEPGQGLRLETTYDNWTGRTLRFGLLSEDEMMILFGAYYTD